MPLREAISRVKTLLPDFAVAMQHGDELRAASQLHHMIEAQQAELRRRTADLEQNIDALYVVDNELNQSASQRLRLRMLCGWQPTEEQKQAMKTLDLDLAFREPEG